MYIKGKKGGIGDPIKYKHIINYIKEGDGDMSSFFLIKQ